MTCCDLCDEPITFYDEHISERTGKKIPLDIDTYEPHGCIVWRNQKNRRYCQCRKGCGAQIYFDQNNEFGLSENGKWVPLEKETGLSHECQ